MSHGQCVGVRLRENKRTYAKRIRYGMARWIVVTDVDLGVKGRITIGDKCGIWG